ncbi:hypothetical protein N7486_004742 [Penicillium sp. IBT 16267x]|nr:hypothetical protein N7486_004742 [Penicillium sp. IBT 16267x]
MPLKKFFESASYPPDERIARNSDDVKETKALKDEYTKLYRKHEKTSQDKDRLTKIQGLLMARFAFDPISEPTGTDWGGANRDPSRANLGHRLGEKGVYERRLDQNPAARTTGIEINGHTESSAGSSKRAVSQTEPNSGAIAVAWCKCGAGKKQRKIYLYTSTSADAIKYEMGSPTELSNDELENLTEVSGTAQSILDLRNEFGRREYGYSNIRKILGVAILSPDPRKTRHTPAGTDGTKSPFPNTTVFVEWQDILPDDLHLLIDGQSKSWEMRSKLLSATPKNQIDELNNWIIDTYTSQNESYARLHNKPPTPVPRIFRMKEVPTSLPQHERRKPNDPKVDPSVEQAEPPQPEKDGAQMDAGQFKSKKRGRRDSDATESPAESAKKSKTHQEATSQTISESKDGTLEDGEEEEDANKEEYGKKASKKRARRDSDPARDLECAKKCRTDREAAGQSGSD